MYKRLNKMHANFSRQIWWAKDKYLAMSKILKSEGRLMIEMIECDDAVGWEKSAKSWFDEQWVRNSAAGSMMLNGCIVYRGAAIEGVK